MKRALFIAAAIIVTVIFLGDFRVAFCAAKGGKKSTQAAAATSQKTALPAGYVNANWKEVRLSIGGPNQGLSQYSVPIGGSIVTPHLGSTMSLANFNYVVHVKNAYVHPLQPDNAAISIDIDLSGERIFSGMVFQSYPHINPFQKKDSSLMFYFVAGDPSIQINGNANNFIADKDGKLYLLYKNTLYSKLNDAGDAWDRVAQGVATLTIDPANKDIIYRSSGSVVEKSMNGGKEWISITNGLPGHEIMGVVINPHNNQEVYALSQGGLYKTVDAGFSWSKTSFNEWPHQFLIHPHDKNIFYVRSFNRLFISKDAGLTWGRIDGTLPKRDVKGKDGSIKKENIGVKALAFIDFEKPFLIALTPDKGILKTEDNGVTWTSYNDGFNAEDGAYAIYSNVSDIYIGGYGCVYHLDNITQKWSKFQIPSSLSVKTITGIHALSKEQGIVVAEKDGKIFQINKDNKVVGLNYGILSHSKILSTLSTTIDGAQRTYAAVINNFFTDISNRSLYFTADHGITWEMSLSWDEACSNMYWEDDVRFVASPHNPKEMWIFPNCGDNYFVTNDGGKDWRKQSGLESNHLYDFVFDPGNKNVKYICAGVNGSTLFLNKSTPDGTPGKWTSLNVNARRVAVNAIDSKKLLTDTLSLSIDGGWTWQNLKENAKSVVSAESYRPLYFNGEEMLVFVDNRDNYYQRGNCYILSSTDSGKAWKIVLKKDRAIIVTFINPNDTKNIVVGYEDNERKVVQFIQSTDRGETWKPFAIYTLSKIDPNVYISLSSAVENGSTVLYVGTKDGLFKTRDDGATWQLIGGITDAQRAPKDVRISAPAPVSVANEPAESPKNDAPTKKSKRAKKSR